MDRGIWIRKAKTRTTSNLDIRFLLLLLQLFSVPILLRYIRENLSLLFILVPLVYACFFDPAQWQELVLEQKFMRWQDVKRREELSRCKKQADNEKQDADNSKGDVKIGEDDKNWDYAKNYDDDAFGQLIQRTCGTLRIISKFKGICSPPRKGVT